MLRALALVAAGLVEEGCVDDRGRRGDGLLRRASLPDRRR